MLLYLQRPGAHDHPVVELLRGVRPDCHPAAPGQRDHVAAAGVEPDPSPGALPGLLLLVVVLSGGGRGPRCWNRSGAAGGTRHCGDKYNLWLNKKWRTGGGQPFTSKTASDFLLPFAFSLFFPACSALSLWPPAVFLCPPPLQNIATEVEITYHPTKTIIISRVRLLVTIRKHSTVT